MSFSLRPFTPPDFTQEKFRNAPNATLVPCPKDGVAPEAYHAMSIFPVASMVKSPLLCTVGAGGPPAPQNRFPHMPLGLASLYHNEAQSSRVS